MSFYIIQDNFLLRGYKGLPFALVYPNRITADFFNKEQYSLVLDCDGNTDIDVSMLSPIKKELFDRLLKLKIIRECNDGEKLKPAQEYILYPSTYKSLVQWSITGRCNYLCKHCFLSAPDYKGEDVSLEKCIHVLDQLVECGINSIGITGGEPLVHKDFYRLIEEISKRNIILESIYTNCALVNDELLDELEKLHLKPGFNISFDGVGHHDWLRGIPGAENKTIEVIKLLKKRGFYVGAAMSVHKKNLFSIRDTIKTLGNLGVDHLKLNGMTYLGNWLKQEDCYLSEEELFDYLINYIPQYFEDSTPLSVQLGIVFDYNIKSKKVSIPALHGTKDVDASDRSTCGVIKKCLYIGANGKILPCMTFSGHAIEKDFDSVYDKPLKDIINNSYYTKFSNATCGECIMHNDRCKECEYKWMCRAGCRAQACEKNKTDYYGIDENNCLFFKGGYYDKTIKVLDQIEKKYELKDDIIEKC